MQRPSIGRAMAAASLCASVCVTVAAQQAAREQTPRIRSGVELVTVDVSVLDKQGNPIRGLGASDFVVTVGDRPRRVVSAEFVDVDAAQGEGGRKTDVVPISTNEGSGIGRLIVFIVDQNTIEPGSARYVMTAASRFLGRLSFNDRSALIVMPTGPSIQFTWAHDRVQTALQRVTGLSSILNQGEFASLTEAKDIANHNLFALRNLGVRECGATSSAGAGVSAGAAAPPTTGGGAGPPAGGTGSGGGQTGGGTGGTTAGGASSGRGSGGSRSASVGGFGTDSCSRDIQMRAEMTWRTALMTSLASLTSLRQALNALAQVQGDKTVILISGGWPLDDRDQISLLDTVASDAAAARATIFTLYIPESGSTVASRRLTSSTPINDMNLHSMPLETLASMTGGGSHRVELGAENTFERLRRELSGYYRIGVERGITDNDGKARHMKVQVSRGATTVRARDIFDTRTYADRDWAARLASALEGPIPATGIGLRVTSYIAQDPDNAGRLKLVLAGEASRLDPGDATFQVLVRDLEGKKVTAGERPLGQPNGDGLTFSTNIPVPPGSYIARVAVIDGAGHVGSVDHRVDAQPVALGPLSATGPLLVRVPTGPDAESRLALNDVDQNERLAIQVDLEGDAARLANGDVVFEIATTTDGPSLIRAPASLTQGVRTGSVFAQAVADMRVLPPGNYIVRAKVQSGGDSLGELRRAFTVVGRGGVGTVAAVADTPAATASTTGVRPATHALSSAPRFALDQVLAPQVVGTFLDRVAARPDAASPAVRDLIERARTAGVDNLTISDNLAKESPVAAFLKGLTLLSQKQLDPAAQAFRSAMRASADFYPAMVYLGACYAAGGKDSEAAGAWRTALIRESDALPLHMLLIDAQLRLNRTDLAFEALERARTRWPSDDGLLRRHAIAQLQAGNHVDGLLAIDQLIEKHAEDEASLISGLLVLYEAFMKSEPIEGVEQDRARMTRLADVYRARGGQSVALVDTWLAAAGKSKN